MDYVDVGKYIVYSFQSPCEYSVIKVCNKDSREITDVDRQRLVDEITMAYSQDGIKDFLITHGTYTMPDTAKYLDKGIPEDIKKNINVVITGAMYPW